MGTTLEDAIIIELSKQPDVTFNRLFDILKNGYGYNSKKTFIKRLNELEDNGFIIRNKPKKKGFKSFINLRPPIVEIKKEINDLKKTYREGLIEIEEDFKKQKDKTEALRRIVEYDIPLINNVFGISIFSKLINLKVKNNKFKKRLFDYYLYSYLHVLVEFWYELNNIIGRHVKDDVLYSFEKQLINEKNKEVSL